MSKQIGSFAFWAMSVAAIALTTGDALAQRGRGGGGRSAGRSAPSMGGHINAGPAMSRMNNAPQLRGNGGAAPNIGNQLGGGQRPNLGGSAITKPNTGFQRPSVGNGNIASKIGEKPNIPGKPGLPNNGGERPGLPGNLGAGNIDRANLAARAGGANSSQLNDFLGIENRPALGTDKPDSVKDRLSNVGNTDRPTIDRDVRTKIGDLKDNSTNINVGNVNVGNSLEFSKNQKAWIDNHHNTGNQVRLNAGNRYANAYANGLYRRNVIGGYPYYRGWNNRGLYYGWRPITYVAVGTFIGAAWVNTQPVYYAYGNGGNVYYENNVVYVDGQSAGTPEQYAAQSTALVASVPAQVDETEWLPLGAFALTREGVADSQAMVEMAINKQGVIAGTYYNEATQVSRSLKGMLDKTTQRVAVGFADGKNADVIMETGIQNLTQDEAPALLHQGKDQSTPVLLVRLQAPTENTAN